MSDSINAIKTCIDREVPLHLQLEAMQVAAAESLKNHPQVMDVGFVRMAMQTNRKWKPGRTLRVGFLSGTNIQQTRVEEQFRKWETYANIKFEIVTSNAEIRVDFQPDGTSWSFIGTDALLIPDPEPTINFGWLFDNTDKFEYQRVVLHEFAHCLGAIHEHQSPAADVNWNKEVVYRYYQGPPNFWTRSDVDVNIFAKYKDTLTNFSEFDPKSIMCYPIPRSFTLDGFSVGWNNDMSPMDKTFMKENYPFVDPTEHRSDIEVDGQVVSGHLDDNVRKEFSVYIPKDGVYIAQVNPANAWISIVQDKKSVEFGKGLVKFTVHEGNCIVRTRNSPTHLPMDYQISIRSFV